MTTFNKAFNAALNEDYKTAFDLWLSLAEDGNASAQFNIGLLYRHQLSGGMRQRTGLARALTIKSDILLMDEPFSAVDEQMRRKLQEDLLNLLRIENKTVIFVTHSIEEAVYLADQVVILSGRPGSITDIVYPEIDRRGEIDLIRRQSRYMELVDEIWSSLKRYVE
jgi:NitT/TauT family transport system ATP-binding protein